MLGRLFALSLLLTLTLGWSAGEDAGVQADTEVVRLEVEAEPGILISRLNPPIIELSNPFEPDDVLTATVDGELYPDDPEFYYARLNPVTWQLAVPQGIAPGRYVAEVRATFSLCSETHGFCFTDEQKALATVQVGGGEKNATVEFQLRQPAR